MKKSEAHVVERYVNNIDGALKQWEKHSEHLKLSSQNEDLRKHALSILKSKVKKMKKAEDEDDLKKVIKLKKLYEKSGLRQ